MELKRHLATIWKWSWLLALAMLIAGGLTYWSGSRAPQLYRATATLMVGHVLQTANPSMGDFATIDRLAQTYVQMARRQPVLEGTVSALGLSVPWQALAAQVNAAAVPNTQLLQISVVAGDPDTAVVLADEVARQLALQGPATGDRLQDERRTFVEGQLQELQERITEAEQQIAELDRRVAQETTARGVQDLQNRIATLQQKVGTWRTNYASLLTSTGGGTNNLRVMESAKGSAALITRSTTQDALVAAIIGLLLALGAVLLIEFLDDTIKTQEDIDRTLDRPFLGAGPRISQVKEAADLLVTLQDPLSRGAESYRVIRTNLQFSSLVRPSKYLLVTSAGPSDGKTTVACNLAITIAQAGKRVILCDANLRRPAVEQLFGISPKVGLTSLLLYDAIPVEIAMLDTPVPGLRILPSGPLPPNPAELLASQQMRVRMHQLGELADVVVFDSPAVLAVSDASLLGTLCGTGVLVVDAGRTRRDQARRAVAVLDQVGALVLGVVLNNAKAAQLTYGDYYAMGNQQRASRWEGWGKAASTPASAAEGGH